MHKITQLRALEILDSRGRPTVKAWCRLEGGNEASASVPSGASTGTAEALELRDGDAKRFNGLGCLVAVEHVNATIAAAVRDRSFTGQEEVDGAMLELDGTPNKSRLGANAMLAVSLAFARAVARADEVPLYRHFGRLIGEVPKALPRLTINLFSGGKHGGGQAPIQDILMVPLQGSVKESLAVAYGIYQAAAKRMLNEYGQRLLRADEGGLAPNFPAVENMFTDALAALREAGYVPGRDVALAVDVAASHFFRNGQYEFAGRLLDAEGMIAEARRWVEQHSVVSVEDALAEDDWAHWPQLCAGLGNGALVLGDDFLCTNPARIRRAIEARAANALLLKVNQIGTLSEAREALQLARSAGWRVTVSARSGETEDDWLADLAVGWGADQIKIGSITQSERLSKYNRLLEIEAQTGWDIPCSSP